MSEGSRSLVSPSQVGCTPFPRAGILSEGLGTLCPLPGGMTALPVTGGPGPWVPPTHGAAMSEALGSLCPLPGGMATMSEGAWAYRSPRTKGQPCQRGRGPFSPPPSWDPFLPRGLRPCQRARGPSVPSQGTVGGDPPGSNSPRPGLGPCGHHGNRHFRFSARYFRSPPSPHLLWRTGSGDALPTPPRRAEVTLCPHERAARRGADEKTGSSRSSRPFRRALCPAGRFLAAPAED